MNVEYTGRQFEITSGIRKEVETSLRKIRKILKDKFDGKVILTVEKHRNKAEITINPPKGVLVGLAQANDMKLAINEALGRLETQAVKYKTRKIDKKRHDRKKWNGKVEAEAESEQESAMTMAVGLTESTAVPVLVHRFPMVSKTT